MKALLITIFILFSSFAFSQYNEVLVLKNTNIIRGKIISTTEEAYRIRTKDGSEYVYRKDEVDHIENYSPNMNTKGYFFRPSFSIAAGENTSLSFHLVNGYQFNKRFDLGFGVGLDNLWDAYIPLFLEGRFYVNPAARDNVFLTGMGGYEMPYSDWERSKGGFTTGVGIGIQHCINNHVGITTQVGYRYAYLTRTEWWSGSIIRNNINRVEIKFGLNIK
ncbi:MAG: hypothetical protein MK078_00255 [Crocinitomicaceae bacterium]|nr:hypothetical protein [Crocinitomicaceae bacterium]